MKLSAIFAIVAAAILSTNGVHASNLQGSRVAKLHTEANGKYGAVSSSQLHAQWRPSARQQKIEEAFVAEMQALMSEDEAPAEAEQEAIIKRLEGLVQEYLDIGVGEQAKKDLQAQVAAEQALYKEAAEKKTQLRSIVTQLSNNVFHTLMFTYQMSGHQALEAKMQLDNKSEDEVLQWVKRRVSLENNPNNFMGWTSLTDALDAHKNANAMFKSAKAQVDALIEAEQANAAKTGALKLLYGLHGAHPFTAPENMEDE